MQPDDLNRFNVIALNALITEILNGNVVSNAKLCVDTTGSNELCCVIQPLFNKSIYAFRITLNPADSEVYGGNAVWSLTSV